jgi:hypothetical protein
LNPLNQFIQALRQGEYHQIKGVLRSVNGYCASGVACDVYRLANKSNTAYRWVHGGAYDSRYLMFFTPEQKYLTMMPDEVRQYFNLSLHHENHIVEMNDSGKSFHEIADWLEQQVLND